MTPDQPSDPPRRIVALPGGPAAYTDVGAGPCVVAVHGLPGSARDFRWLGAALEPHVRLVRIDMPGFGETPLATEPSAHMDRRADFVASVIAALGLDRPLVIGHSMGGAVATALAVRHPDAARGLALLASIGPVPHRSFRNLGPRHVLSWALRVPPIRAIAGPRLRDGFERAGFRGYTVDQHVHTLHCVAAVDFAAHRANLAALRTPTLVAWARDDAFVEDAISERLYWAAPHGPRIAFPDGGHSLQKSRAVELSEALLAWIAQLWSA